MPNGGQGLFAQFTVGQDGSWTFTADGCSASGQVYKDGTVDGSLSSTNGDFWIEGDRPSANPPFPNLGYYSGTWKTGSRSGPLYSIFDADGNFVYGVLYSAKLEDGGFGTVQPGATSFTSTSVNGTLVSGHFNNTATPSISGTSSGASGSGTFSMTRAGVVSTQTAPTLTAPLPPQVVTYGQTATFSAKAGGSAPLCYQWYANGAVLDGATTSSLVITNVQAQDDGTYSVLVRNLVGSTNASNTLTAVPENVPPTLKITSPTPGQKWLGPAQFTVKGTAADNVQVSNVWYQLTNNPGWYLASTTNNGTQWTAVVTNLTPGLNTVQAYAEDTSGNHSKTTNSVSFTYVVSAPLAVNAAGCGKGAWSPNYTNGQWLVVSNKYSMTAHPGSGCLFTGWTGSQPTNKPTLFFTMSPGLTFTANFTNPQLPKVTITSPGSKAHPTNGTVAASGTASDNVGVAGVYWNLNGQGWSNAMTAKNGTTWTATVTPLAPATNTLVVQSVNGCGTPSLPSSVSFFCLRIFC